MQLVGWQIAWRIIKDLLISIKVIIEIEKNLSWNGGKIIKRII